MYKIVRSEAFSDTTFLWEVLAPDVAASAEPGHFVMVRLHEGSERIPLTVADFDRDKGTITMVIQSLGKTTLEMRDHYKEGANSPEGSVERGLYQELAAEEREHVALLTTEYERWKTGKAGLL